MNQNLENIMNYLIAVLLFILSGICFYAVVLIQKNINRNKAILKRTVEVESFRNRMAGKYGYEGLEAMPSEEEMIADDRELTEENYLNFEK